MCRMQRLFWVTLLVTTLFSCSKEKLEDPSQTSKTSVLERIKSLGFNTGDIVEYKDYYVVEGDIVFMKNDTLQSKLKQARTTNLVTKTTINVYLNTNFTSLNNQMNNALNSALAAYNAVSFNLRFTRTTVQSQADIIVTMDNSIRIINGYEYEVCGQGGFPYSDGRPFNSVRIAEKTLVDNNITGGSELIFLLVHELGHNIGLRHTNWSQRGESASPYGAIQISGTPTSDGNSVMNAATCGYSWGGFSNYDEIALETMYPASVPWRWITHSKVGSGWPSDWLYLTNDFTGDKVTDIVVRQTDGKLTLYPWTGSSWGNIRDIGTGWNFTHYFGNDFTGDGIADLVVRQSNGVLTLYPWNGSSWGNIRDIGSGWPADWKYFIGDFTGDRIADIVVRKPNGILSLYPWNGSSWGNIRDIGSGWPADWTYLINDFTGDGITDIVVRKPDGILSIYPWNGSSWGNIRDIGSGWNFTHYFAEDFTGDGISDIMVRNSNGELQFYQWSGSSWTTWGTVGTGWNFSHYFAKDFNNDKRCDLMVRGTDGFLHYYEWHFNN